jgi:DNA polymerase elongation subunit (family B)
MKFLTQHTNKEDFFKELKEDEIFMYSYHDFKWDDIIKFAEEYKIKIDYIKKGSEDYKKYGECSAKVINIKTKTFNFKINSKESIEIKSHSEELARLRLLDILFNKGYIKLE